MSASNHTWQVVTCEATFTSTGRPQPHAIVWQGEHLAVQDTGRRWQSDDGLHLLARVTDGRMFELRYNGATWWGRVRAEPPMVV